MVALEFLKRMRHPQPLQSLVHHPALRQHPVGRAHIKSELEPGQIGLLRFQPAVQDRSAASAAKRHR